VVFLGCAPFPLRLFIHHRHFYRTTLATLV
jgi:hypothetical protein